MGGVERDGQLRATFFYGEPLDARDYAAGGKRNVLRRDRERFGIEDNAQRVHYGVEVQQRFALAHEDEIGLWRELRFVLLERNQDLRENFPGREIADQAELRGQAELAVDGAPCLRGDADGLAAGAGHKHRLDRRWARFSFRVRSRIR